MLQILYLFCNFYPNWFSNDNFPQARLERLVNSGYCTQAEIDGQLKSKLTMLSEEDALSAIDEMNLIERSEIRQFASYFMGIMNRYGKLIRG